MSNLSVQELKRRIENNDNRCTAKPYLLLLQEKRRFVSKEGYNLETEVIYIETVSGDNLEFKTMEELTSFLNEDVEVKPIEGENYKILEMGHYWETTNVFLTDQGYQDHLQENGHNLGEHRTYGIHAFRNNEIKSLMEVLSNHELESSEELSKSRYEVVKLKERVSQLEKLMDHTSN